MQQLAWVALITVATCVCHGCRRSDPPPAPPPPEPVATPLGSPSAAVIPAEHLDRIVDLFNRGVALMDQQQPAEAARAFEEIVRLAPRWTTARVNLGIALLNAQGDTNFSRAEDALETAIAVDPEDPYAHYSLGMLWRHLGRYEQAGQQFRRVLQLDSDDPDAHFQMAMLLTGKDDAAARKHLETTLEQVPHHESACYRLQGLLRKAGEKELAAKMLQRFQALKASGAGVTYSMNYGQMGRYAQVVDSIQGLPTPSDRMADPPHFQDIADSVGLVVAAGGETGVPAAGLSAPGAWGPGVAVEDIDDDGDLDIYIPGAAGDQNGTFYLNEEGHFMSHADSGIDGRGAVAAYFGDFDGDGRPDLYLTCAGPNRLYRNEGSGRFSDVTEQTGTAGRPFLSVGACWADADHDGDLDIYVANVSRVDDAAAQAGAPNALWRNNGDGTFTDVAPQAGIDGGNAVTVNVLFFDADADRDVDLYLVNHQSANQLFLNNRAGEYIDATAKFSQLADDGSGVGALVGDVDRNGREDLLLLRLDQPPRLFLRTGAVTFEEDQRFAETVRSIPGSRSALWGDFDLDGDLDLALLDADASTFGHHLLMNAGGGKFASAVCFAPQESRGGARGAVCADVDGDGSLELLVAQAGNAPQLWRAALPAERNWLTVIPERRPPSTTKKRAPHAMGLMVEVKTGSFSQVMGLSSSTGYLGSPPAVAHFGLGQASKVDYLRLTWPDAILQSELEVPADQQHRVLKAERKASSCPLLFAWDGQRFAFVTDFLGVGGLGFFVAPGTYAVPDPTEDVRIPPELIRRKHGRYALRIAEPLEEVCYFDQLHLVVHDHPAEWDLYPDERFTSDLPHRGGGIVSVADRIFPLAARDQKGRDVRQRLLEIDRDRVEPETDKRFVGYAKDHWVDLDFGQQLMQWSKDSLALCLYGWTEYTYSHVNYAAYQAGIQMRPPEIEVLDAEGNWRTAIEDAGFPAGMPRMMTLDISALPIRATGRLRIRSNMHVCWDQIFAAKNEADGKVNTYVLEPSIAELRMLGYPREYSPDGDDPTLYDYHRNEQSVAFKNLTGNYTRLGDVRPLLRDVDDQFVIMGRGEEIVLEFDPQDLPDLPVGYSRTLVLHADGYCKDMDLYTAFPDTVEPLPYHAMDNYPPDKWPVGDGSWENYRRHWNTRRITGM